MKDNLIVPNDDPRGLRAELERAAQQLDRLQYLREWYVNSVDAYADRCEIGMVAVTTPSGEVVLKMAFADNGTGMEPDDLVSYMRTIRKSSSATDTLDGHYGWGARVASLSTNHFGLVVISKDAYAAPRLVRMWKATAGAHDPVDGLYEMQEFGANKKLSVAVDPRVTTTVPGFGSFCLADCIGVIGRDESFFDGDHWTVVIFGGIAEGEHTVSTANPNDTTSPMNYLGWKLVDAPARIRMVTPRTSDRTAWPEIEVPFVSGGGGRDRGSVDPREIRPLSTRFHGEHSGVMELDDGVAVHWAFDPDLDLDKPAQTGRLGFVAYSLDVETMTYSTGREAMPDFRTFGIPQAKAHKAIALRIALPIARTLADVGAFSGDANRINLRWSDGSGERCDLPKQAWGAEFQRKMPKALRAFISSVLTRSVERQDEKQDEYRRKLLNQHGHELKRTIRFLSANNPTTTVDPNTGGSAERPPVEPPVEPPGWTICPPVDPPPPLRRRPPRPVVPPLPAVFGETDAPTNTQGVEDGSSPARPRLKSLSGPEVAWDETDVYELGEHEVATLDRTRNAPWGVLYLNRRSKFVSGFSEKNLALYAPPTAAAEEKVLSQVRDAIWKEALDTIVRIIALLGHHGDGLDSEVFASWTTNGALSSRIMTATLSERTTKELSRQLGRPNLRAA